MGERSRKYVYCIYALYIGMMVSVLPLPKGGAGARAAIQIIVWARKPARIKADAKPTPTSTPKTSPEKNFDNDASFRSRRFNSAGSRLVSTGLRQSAAAQSRLFTLLYPLPVFVQQLE